MLKFFEQLKPARDYSFVLIKWLVLSVLIGLASGVFGSAFHHAVDEATHLRNEHGFILLFLPVAGLIIVFLYHVFKMDNDKGTNAIIQSVRSGEKVSFRTVILIFTSTVLTHLCGGSAGREGAALQIGGGIGSLVGSIFKVKEHDRPVVIMCGMSALFSAVFGTPLTAAVFSLEVVSVGIMHYGALFPCVMSALVAYSVAGAFGVSATHFTLLSIPAIDYFIVLKVICLAVLISLFSIVFITVMHSSSKLYSKYIPSKYLKAFVGGILVICLTFIFKTTDYNGAGMDIIAKAVETGTAEPFAFLIKLIFTAATLSAGFKGGEIVPTFFMGSTLGVTLAPILGLESSFAAGIGLISLFCGVVNCPLASIILSIEIFGPEGILYFAIASSVSYIISGYYSLYTSQKIVYSKLFSIFIDRNAK